VALLALGTLGLAVTEHRGVWYALQQTVDTVATVGSMPSPHTTGGQIVKVVLIMLGVGTLFYALVSVTEFFVAGHVGELLAQRRMQKMIDSLSDHHIICGFGRVGRQVAHDLRAAQAEYVIIDSKPENREMAAQHGDVHFISGDGADDAVLRQAGIERARAILACADSDAENIFITLTARELAPQIAIVARASVEDSEKKLKRAGADRVISPYRASGAEMARLALHPQVSGVVDVAPEYRMEEIEVTPGCEGAGQRIADISGSSLIVALRRPDGKVEPQPGTDTQLLPGDVLVAAGTSTAMERLEGLFTPSDREAAAETS
jgi:voltage-gated potassium channel